MSGFSLSEPAPYILDDSPERPVQPCQHSALSALTDHRGAPVAVAVYQVVVTEAATVQERHRDCVR